MSIKHVDPEVLGTLHVLCRDCGECFTIGPSEQKWLKARGLELFSRCAACRKKRREAEGQKGSFAPPGEKRRPW